MSGDPYEEFSENFTKDELVEVMNDKNLLKDEGFHITPKGYIALKLMSELGFKPGDASRFAQEVEDDIVRAGYIIVSAKSMLGDVDEFDFGD